MGTTMRFRFGFIALAALLAAPTPALLAQARAKERPAQNPTFYRTTQIDGLSIFYREAGPKNASTLLLLHGVPSSSRMFEPLFARLSDRYHLVAPDYPGFGHSQRAKRSPAHRRKQDSPRDETQKVKSLAEVRVSSDQSVRAISEKDDPVGWRPVSAAPPLLARCGDAPLISRRVDKR